MCGCVNVCGCVHVGNNGKRIMLRNNFWWEI